MNHLNLSIQLAQFNPLEISNAEPNIAPTCFSSDGDVLPIPNLPIIFEAKSSNVPSPHTNNNILTSHFSAKMVPIVSAEMSSNPDVVIACFSIENSICYLPSMSMISQLFYPRKLDTSFINDIVEIYEIPEDIHIKFKAVIESMPENDNFQRSKKGFSSSPLSSQVLFDKESLTKSWGKIAKILNESHSDEDLYKIISLQKYKKPLQLQREDHASSLVTFLTTSNFVTNQIMHEVDNPSSADIITKNFCERNGIDFKRVQYQESVVKYFDRMLPLPHNFISNIERNVDLNNFFISESHEYEKCSDREVTFPEDPKQRLYMQRILKSEKIKRILFKDYYNSISIMYEFWNRLHAECPEISREILAQNKKNFNTQMQSRSNTIINEQLSIHSQCLFCNLFSTMEVRKGHNEPSYHCGRTQCEQSYGAWGKHLNRNGYNLRANLD
jgi:hypothetical protein